MIQLAKELEIACMLARLAGERILEIYEKDFSVEYKEDESPLTLADKESNELIVSGLRKEFPEYAVLAEESRDDKSRLTNDWCWVVDPLDGTKEFIKRNGEFTVNIALTYRGEVVLGVIFVPVKNELYYAARGKGAFLERDGSSRKISVSDKRDKLRIVSSRSHGSEDLDRLLAQNQDKISEVVSAGSSLKGCLIAEGNADAYYRYGLTMEWDTAAMQCIVEEAGGFFRQLDGNLMRYNRENSLNEMGFYILNHQDNLFV